MRTPTAYFNKISDIRIQLRNTIFKTPISIGEFIELLSLDIDSMSTNIGDYNEISIKIKKTTMKKKSNFIHNVDYYYPIVTTAYSIFLHKHREDIRNIIGDDIIHVFNNVNLLFNIECISDNILLIKI